MLNEKSLAGVAQTMSSLQIAELTNKRHDAILRDIRNLIEQGVDLHNFVEMSYVDKNNRQYPCYQLTKTGCLILASGYNAKLREAIINRWEELEKEKLNGGFAVPTSFAEALQLAADQARQIEKLETCQPAAGAHHRQTQTQSRFCRHRV